MLSIFQFFFIGESSAQEYSNLMVEYTGTNRKNTLQIVKNGVVVSGKFKIKDNNNNIIPIGTKLSDFDSVTLNIFINGNQIPLWKKENHITLEEISIYKDRFIFIGFSLRQLFWFVKITFLKKGYTVNYLFQGITVSMSYPIKSIVE
jgi:hypothetical protein